MSMSMHNSLATKDSGLRTQGPVTRTRSRVGTAPPSPFATPHRSTALRLFDVPPTEGALSSRPPLVIDCADAHARDIQLAHAHAVPFSYLEQRARQEPWGPAGSTSPCGSPCGATITAKTRLILINWLAEVTSSIHQKIADETLHLAVNYLDRFLFKSPGCNIGHLQLVGVTSLLIASKFEETFPIAIEDLLYVSDKMFDKKQVLNCECIMLSTLRFELCTATSRHFLSRFAKVAGVLVERPTRGDLPAGPELLASYLIDLALAHYDMLHFTPDIVAAAALHVALGRFGRLWPPALEAHEIYSGRALHVAIIEIRNMAAHAHAISPEVESKYQDDAHGRVSTIAI